LTSSWDVLGGAAPIPTVTLLAAPAAIIFFLLTGLVFVFGVPSELRANWLFQTISERKCDVAQRVARRLMLIFLAPLVALVTVVYSTAWGVRLGSEHAAFVLVTSWILIEVFADGLSQDSIHLLVFFGEAQRWDSSAGIFSCLFVLLAGPGERGAPCAVLPKSGSILDPRDFRGGRNWNPLVRTGIGN